MYGFLLRVFKYKWSKSEGFLRLWEEVRELQNRWITNVSKRHEPQGTIRKIMYGLCVCTTRYLKTSKYCRANLGSRRTQVERQILSIPVNDKLFIWMFNAKRIRYGSEITSPTCSKGKFQSWCFKRMLKIEESLNFENEISFKGCKV